MPGGGEMVNWRQHEQTALKLEKRWCTVQYDSVHGSLVVQEFLCQDG